MSGPRVEPGKLRELGLLNWVLCRGMALVTRVPDIHLMSTLGRQRGLFRSWLRFSASMMPGGTIPRRETELAILRVAHLRQCRYELDHHERIGRREGIDTTQLGEVALGPEAPGFDARQRALLRAVDALVRDKDLDDATWSALRAHYSEAQTVELCLLVGQYEMLATTIAALRIERDFVA